MSNPRSGHEICVCSRMRVCTLTTPPPVRGSVRAMSIWKTTWLLVGLSGFLSAQQGGMPARNLVTPLTPPQAACLGRLADLICCVITSCCPWEACLGPWDRWSCDAVRDCPLELDVEAEGGFNTNPAKAGFPHPLVGGEFEGANGQSQDPNHDPGTKDPIAVDPGAFTVPDQNGNVYYHFGTGPNAGGGVPGSGPFAATPQFFDLIAAGYLYGELGHQDLGCKYGANGRPATEQDSKNLNRSEARVYGRAAEFFLWLYNCDECWSAGLPLPMVNKIRARLYARAMWCMQNHDRFLEQAGG